MKAILYLDNGSKVVADILTPPHRRERETQREYEQRIVDTFNASQPRMLHKIARIKLMRN